MNGQVWDQIVGKRVFSVPRLPMVLRYTELHALWLRATGGRSDRCMTCPSIRLMAAITVVANMAEAPTPRELRSMSHVEKKVNLGVKQRGVMACTLGQVAYCREMSPESGFSLPVEVPNVSDESRSGASSERQQNEDGLTMGRLEQGFL